MDDLYKLFLAIYATTKYVLGLNKSELGRLSRYLLIFLTIVLLTLIVFGTIIVYSIFELVDLYLRKRHLEKYGGMLKNFDFLMEATENLVGVNVLFIVKRNKSYEEFEESICEEFRKLHESCFKLRCEVKTFLVYKYYLKTNVKFENLVTVVNDVNLTKENIEEFLSDNFMDSRSLLGDKNWRIFIFKNPIKWSEKPDEVEHLVVITFRHSVADGVGWTGFVANKLDGIEIVPLSDKLKMNPVEKHNYRIDDVYIYDNPLKQNGIFPRSDSRNYMIFHFEDKVEYVPLMKAIKTKLKVGFTDVFSGCLAAALVAYAKKNGKDIKHLKLANMIRPMDRDTLNMLRGEFDFNKTSNKMMITTMNAPSDIGAKPLSEIVRGCFIENQNMKQGADLILLFTLANIAHIGGIPLSKFVLNKICRAANLGITNVVGLKSAAIGGYNIEYALPFLSESLDAGFILLVWSLGNRLQLCFTGPKSILGSRKDLRNILGDMFKNIAILNKDYTEK